MRASFFLYNLWYRMSILQCRSKLSHSFLSGDQLPTFYLLHFQCCEISLKVPLMWSFVVVFLVCFFFLFFSIITSSGISLSLSSQPLSSFLSVSSSGCISRVSQVVAVSVFPQLTLSSITPFKFNWNSLPALLLSMSLLKFHSSWPIPSFNYSFL